VKRHTELNTDDEEEEEEEEEEVPARRRGAVRDCVCVCVARRRLHIDMADMK
jgi:hypothetical protein